MKKQKTKINKNNVTSNGPVGSHTQPFFSSMSCSIGTECTGPATVGRPILPVSKVSIRTLVLLLRGSSASGTLASDKFCVRRKGREERYVLYLSGRTGLRHNSSTHLDEIKFERQLGEMDVEFTDSMSYLLGGV